jgi:MoxR-like ATPase
VASLNADWAITKQNPLPGGRTKAKAPTPPPVPKPTPLIDIIIDEPTAIEQGTEPEPPAPNTGLEQLGAILGPIMQPYIKQQKVDISALKEQMDQRLQEIDERIKERIDNLQPVEKIIMVDREKAKRIDVGRQHRQYEEVCEIMLSLRKRKQNVLLIGPAGSGKSQCAHQFAKGIGGDFWLQSCGPGTQEFHFWGHTTATGDYMPTPTWNAFQPSDKPRVLCIDEIDSSSPDVGLVLNAITNGDDACFPHPVGCLPRPEDLFIFATGNTFNGADQKFVGRYEMDGALRDRFVVIKFGHDLAFEEVLYPEFPEWRKYVQACREAVDSLRLSYVVSSRAIQKGTDLLASGRLGKPRIEEVCLWGDGALPAEDVRRVREKVKADVGLVWA